MKHQPPPRPDMAELHHDLTGLDSTGPLHDAARRASPPPAARRNTGIALPLATLAAMLVALLASAILGGPHG